jgi:hypothetical protein
MKINENEIAELLARIYFYLESLPPAGGIIPGPYKHLYQRDIYMTLTKDFNKKLRPNPETGIREFVDK